MEMRASNGMTSFGYNGDRLFGDKIFVMVNILFVGIGGVGGYFGGLMARAFEKDPYVNINFLTKQDHVAIIRDHGICVQTLSEGFTAMPARVSDNTTDLGVMDYIILCVKNYDLREVLGVLAPCIGGHTVIVPLLNGVDHHKDISVFFPNTLVAEGCVNVIVRSISTGKITCNSDFADLHFGVQGMQDIRLKKLDLLFKQGGIYSKLTSNISTSIWQKFMLISTVATATCFYNKNFGQIRMDPNCLEGFGALVQEISCLASRKGILLPKDNKDKIWKIFRKMPACSTSSMHTDFLSLRNKTELESLTGYIVREGDKFKLALPTYSCMYSALSIV